VASAAMTTFLSNTMTLAHASIVTIIRPAAINVEETTGL
jgi:hypothetical protein